ncbi:MAG: hypothetical protein WDN66_03680 [Candidatus Saccharibacteria bacterium]
MKFPEEHIIPGRRKWILGLTVGYLAIGGVVELFGIPVFEHSADYSAKMADMLALVAVGTEATLTGMDAMVEHIDRRMPEQPIPEQAPPENNVNV